MITTNRPAQAKKWLPQEVLEVFTGDDEMFKEMVVFYIQEMQAKHRRLQKEQRYYAALPARTRNVTVSRRSEYGTGMVIPFIV